ncbi:DUF4129 domain-containing protein [Mechercharimyces sp. CAU 1602]|uniref:DUF4129 domain-containing protein n=1 Tax=Mechercharimyces sp. CAU 1602 TaxID=2973933 RepID=UPI002162A9A7|nr:DUF4129 domain-containing protein [Mechercharimyces sp. CAU 1602]MCS1351108.1 DUF4129 domain-containing protein [Mechercharimyces sp. CAU 1602]
MNEQERARVQLEEILRADEFTDESRLGRIVDSVRNWIDTYIYSWIEKWWIQMFGEETSSSLQWLLPLLAGIFVACLIWWMRGRIEWGMRRGSDSVRREEEKDPFMSTRDWWHEGEVLAEERAYREAMRFLFLAVLQALEERGALLRMVEKTNLDYIEEVRRNSPELREVFGQLTAQFDSAWYGMVHTSAADYRSFYQLARTMVKGGEENETT